MAPKAKILLVDDDPDFLEMHELILKNHGYAVRKAKSGEEGFEMAHMDMPDLIVLDLMMEKHDSGFSLSHQLKKDPLLRKIPILMVTSVAEITGFKFNYEKDGYWMKTDDFLDKPVKPEVLIQRVEKLLKQKP